MGDQLSPNFCLWFSMVSLLLESQDHSLSSPLHEFSLHLHLRLPFLLLSTSVLQPPLPPLWSWNIPSTLPPQSLYTCYFLWNIFLSIFSMAAPGHPGLSCPLKIKHSISSRSPNPSPPNHYLLSVSSPFYLLCSILFHSSHSWSGICFENHFFPSLPGKYISSEQQFLPVLYTVVSAESGIVPRK